MVGYQIQMKAYEFTNYNFNWCMKMFESFNAIRKTEQTKGNIVN
jgi:hypothetical protein